MPLPSDLPPNLPKQELLTKLLKMTSSSNDGEALTAMRKANALLSSAGWDWDMLMAGKITVVADPFGSVPVPQQKSGYGNKPSAPPPPRPQQRAPSAPPPQAQRAPRPPPRPQTPIINSQRTNAYGGWCYCCGNEVASRLGFIFQPKVFNPGATCAPDKWMIACDPCNRSVYATIQPSPAPRKKQSAAPPDLYTL